PTESYLFNKHNLQIVSALSTIFIANILSTTSISELLLSFSKTFILHVYFKLKHMDKQGLANTKYEYT
ncbi:hypothetical protein EPK46_14940, partial [Enterococcus faecalis]|nr:hypothetical protein [Enterococcus faecalis]